MGISGVDAAVVPVPPEPDIVTGRNDPTAVYESTGVRACGHNCNQSERSASGDSTMFGVWDLTLSCNPPDPTGSCDPSVPVDWVTDPTGGCDPSIPVSESDW